MKNLLLFALLFSLHLTILNAQSVSGFSIQNGCNSSTSFFNAVIEISGTTQSQCFGMGNIDVTWNGFNYTAGGFTGYGGGNCDQLRSFFTCVGGNPSLTFPATIVIHTPPSIAGTYITDGAGNLVLPVDLVSFTAKQDNQVVQLDWQTASEENNAGFEVQRSNNGEEWEIIDFVEGNGTTLEVQNYVYTDETPLNGENYYRLKQIDFDEQYEYSNIINLTIQQSNNRTIQIFPNPVKEQFTIQGVTGRLSIYNVLGQSIYTAILDKNNNQIPMTSFPSGQYFVEVLSDDGQKIAKRIVKK